MDRLVVAEFGDRANALHVMPVPDGSVVESSVGFVSQLCSVLRERNRSRSTDHGREVEICDQLRNFYRLPVFGISWNEVFLAVALARNIAIAG